MACPWSTGLPVKLFTRKYSLLSRALQIISSLKRLGRKGLADWITAHTHAFEYIGGVPNLVVPDNSKVAVIKACLYEPQMHRTYADMASHYRVAILPERAYRGAMGFSVVCVIVVSTALLNLTSPSGSSSNNSTKITKSAVSASLDVSCSRSSITRL